MRILLPLVLLFAFWGPSSRLAAVENGETRGSKGEIPEAVFIPTPRDIAAEMLKLADVQKADVVYDLGCGDGRIVIAAARKYGSLAVGFDIDPLRIRESRENVRKARLEALVKIKNEDVFGIDLRGATVVTLYLSSRLNERLIPQLQRLRPGARIVSHQFGIAGVRPDRVIRIDSMEDRHKHTLYLWQTPFKVLH